MGTNRLDFSEGINMKPLCTLQVNGKYLEKRSPTVWGTDELFAEPLTTEELVDVIKKVVGTYHRHNKPYVITVEPIQ